ncbi:PIN domain-containing protein [bacterium]|nr:PIN domain-containing protein [bacterium]
MNLKVIADSTIWKEYLEKGNTKEAKALEKLIRNDRIVACGYTFTQILKGIKDKETFEKLLKGFLALPYVEIEKEDWIKASKIVFEFKGLSLEEGLLCALSQRKNLKILTKNKEIKKIKGVKVYEDEKE